MAIVTQGKTEASFGKGDIWKKPPRPFTLAEGAMRQDVARYREKGFDYISSFACYLGEDYEALYGEADIRPLADALREEGASPNAHAAPRPADQGRHI